MQSRQLRPEVRVLPLNVKDIAPSVVTVQVASDHGPIQSLGSRVLELRQLAGGKLPGEVRLLLPGVAVVLLVLCDSSI